MKTIRVLLPMFILIALSACEKENLYDLEAQGLVENPIPSPLPQEDLLPEDFLHLSYTEHTREDQMGKFAENAMVAFNGKVWSVGGKNEYSGGSSINAVWASDNGENWHSVTSGIFDGRSKHTLTVFDNKMWLIGGVNNSGRHLSDVWYSDDGSDWTLATDTPIYGSAAYHGTIVFNERLYLIKANGSLTEVWSTTNGVDWRQETAAAFGARENFETVVFDDQLYVLGGSHLSVKYNTIWKTEDGVNWMEVTTGTVFTPRSHHTAVVYNDKVWVAGGFGHSRAEGNLWYSHDMENWTEYEPLSSENGLFDHAMLNYNDAMWLFGGYEQEVSEPYRMTGKIRSIKED